MQPRAKGLALTLLATLWISPDALLITLLSTLSPPTPPSQIVFYKFLFAFFSQTLLTCWVLRSTKVTGKPGFISHLLSLKTSGHLLPLSLLYSFASITLSYAFVFTSSANALVLYSLHIVWTSLGGYWWLGDSLEKRSKVLVMVGGGCALAVFWGEKEESESNSNSNSNSELGCLLALVASLMWAGLMLTIRLASQSPRLPREASLLPATCLGSLLSVILVLPIGGDVFVTGE